VKITSCNHDPDFTICTQCQKGNHITNLEAQVEQLGKQFDEIADINDQLHARNEKLQAQLERIRNLKGFFVPLSPPIEKAVWKSDIEAAIKGDK